MSRPIRSRRAGLDPGESRRRPLYARVLGLQYLDPGGLLCFLFFEGVVALGILLALAELVSWWGVLVLPASVAVMVKVNDVIAGATSRSAAPAAAHTRAARPQRAAPEPAPQPPPQQQPAPSQPAPSALDAVAYPTVEIPTYAPAAGLGERRTTEEAERSVTTDLMAIGGGAGVAPAEDREQRGARWRFGPTAEVHESAEARARQSASRRYD